jgi:hypothetical protein
VLRERTRSGYVPDHEPRRVRGASPRTHQWLPLGRADKKRNGPHQSRQGDAVLTADSENGRADEEKEAPAHERSDRHDLSQQRPIGRPQVARQEQRGRQRTRRDGKPQAESTAREGCGGRGVGAAGLRRYVYRTAVAAPGNTRVNCAYSMWHAAPEAGLAWAAETPPVRRVDQPHDVAAAILRVATNGFVTGTVLDVSGGATLAR